MGVRLRPLREDEFEDWFDRSRRRRGFDRISLNVFAGNAAARSLYASLGYYERSVYMSKSLT